MQNGKKYLIAIVGPTAVGKTSISIELAKKLHCDILSCDSRQFYKELEIGTAKPSPLELSEAKHHFINNLSIESDYTVMDFEKDAIQKIAELHQKDDCVILVGGSGLFYKAIVDGFDEIPSVDTQFRSDLIQELEDFGIEKLQNELKEKDYEYYNKMDIQNTQRLIRALEICRGTGKPFSSFRTGKKKSRDFEIVKVGLEMERSLLFDRINSRMDLMIESGLLDEVQSLVNYKEKNALQTVGYKEVFDFLDDKYDWTEAERLLKRNSRRYAKRQMTWFKRDEEINWIDVDPTNSTKAFRSILKLLK